MLLNNLNLENMPKDEALLNILKQILDTVTFLEFKKVIRLLSRRNISIR